MSISALRGNGEESEQFHAGITNLPEERPEIKITKGHTLLAESGILDGLLAMHQRTRPASAMSTFATAQAQHRPVSAAAHRALSTGVHNSVTLPVKNTSRNAGGGRDHKGYKTSFDRLSVLSRSLPGRVRARAAECAWTQPNPENVQNAGHFRHANAREREKSEVRPMSAFSQIEQLQYDSHRTCELSVKSGGRPLLERSRRAFKSNDFSGKRDEKGNHTRQDKNGTSSLLHMLTAPELKQIPICQLLPHGLLERTGSKVGAVSNRTKIDPRKSRQDLSWRTTQDQFSLPTKADAWLSIQNNLQTPNRAGSSLDFCGGSPWLDMQKLSVVIEACTLVRDDGRTCLSLRGTGKRYATLALEVVQAIEQLQCETPEPNSGQWVEPAFVDTNVMDHQSLVCAGARRGARTWAEKRAAEIKQADGNWPNFPRIGAFEVWAFLPGVAEPACIFSKVREKRFPSKEEIVRKMTHLLRQRA